MNPCLTSPDPGWPSSPAASPVGQRPPASPQLGSVSDITPAAPPSYQVCVSVPSPALRPSPASPEDSAPDLECWVCYSHFNNVFRCPKRLECQHTFCLECLARINVKSAQPAAIRCPLCRRVTPLPALGLPQLATDAHVLESLPPAMRRVYSVRFQRSKGKLHIKRLWQGRRQCTVRTLDVGLPSPPFRNAGQSGSAGGALCRLTGPLLCRVLLLTLVLTMTVVMAFIVVFLFMYNQDLL